MTTLMSNSFDSLGWLNINDKSEVNDAVMVHKCPNKLAPNHLCDQLQTGHQ